MVFGRGCGHVCINQWSRPPVPACTLSPAPVLQVLLSASGTAKLADVGLSRLQTKTVLSDLSLIGTFAWWVLLMYC